MKDFTLLREGNEPSSFDVSSVITKDTADIHDALLREDKDVKRKILFVIDTLEFGGAEQSLLANAMLFRKIEPLVCHIYSGSTLKSKFIEGGISVYSLNVTRKYGFTEAFSKLRELVRKEKPEMIVAYLTRSEIVARLVGMYCKIPVIGTFVNDLYCHTYNRHLSWQSKKVVQLFKLINKITSKKCLGFVSNSESIKWANSRHLNIPLDKITVINRGRDSSKIICRDLSKFKMTDVIHFVNVSRLFTVKGQRQLLLGFKKFLDHYPHATLSIIGEGPLRNELAEIIHSYDLEKKIFLLGSRSDVPSILKEFDCFIFPSLMEGFSGSVVEAMFAGLPVLASDIPQNKEVISHQKTGYLFATDSVEAIVQSMLWFKENQVIAHEHAINAYKDAKERFELRRIVMQFENYLNNKIELKN